MQAPPRGTCTRSLTGRRACCSSAGSRCAPCRRRCPGRFRPTRPPAHARAQGPQPRRRGAAAARGGPLLHGPGTARALGLSEGAPRLAEGAPRLSEGVPRLHLVRAGAQIAIGSLRVKPFATTHDAAEPVGFLLESRITRERLLFATDTAYVRVRVPAPYGDRHRVQPQPCAAGGERPSPRGAERARARTWRWRRPAPTLRAGPAARERIYLLHLSAVHSDAAAFAARRAAGDGRADHRLPAKSGTLGEERIATLRKKEEVHHGLDRSARHAP